MVRLRRLGLGAVLFLGIALLVVFAAFRAWIGSIEANLETRSRVIMTARGPIEYAEIGRGPPVLVVHGTPGGYDQPLRYLEATHRSGSTHYIIPSRPGYLRTPLSVGSTPADQARAFAALLDALGTKRVA